MISILLAAYKSEELLEHVFVRSYNKTAPWHELIIYDNGGNGNYLESLKILESVTNIKVVGSGENIGLNAALNECAKVAKGDWFYLPHTDMYLMPGWDTALLQAVKNQPPGSQLLCSRSIEPTKGHTEFHIIKNYGMEHDELKEKKLLSDFADYKDNTIVTGYRMPFFMHRALWSKMQGVDPKYFSYCTDDDLVQTAYDCGVRKFWMVYNSLVYHLQGKSNSQQTVDKDSNKPYEYFVKKWREKGFPQADHPARWHPELIPWYQRIA